MNREKNLARLSSLNVDISHPYYLHYISYHKELKSAIKNYAKGDLLDIGCGNKPYESLFEGLISKYVGCDIIQSSLNKVEVLSPANNIPLDDNSFDTVLSTQTIEHVEDHQGLVNEAYRLLKPGGYFILSGPFCWPIHEAPYDFFRFTKYGFKYILEQSNFQVIEIKENGGAWANAGQILINTIESTTANNLFFKIVFKLYYKLNFRIILNMFFSYMDKKFYSNLNTINYVVIAKKNL